MELSKGGSSQSSLLTAISQPSTTLAITISDSTNLTGIVTKGIYVSVPLGATSTIAMKLTGDAAATSVVLNANQFLPGNFLRVMSTGTTLNGATIIGYGG